MRKSKSRRVDKEMWWTYTVLFSHKEKQNNEKFRKWMELENTILGEKTEVQKEKSMGISFSCGPCPLISKVSVLALAVGKWIICLSLCTVG